MNDKAHSIGESEFRHRAFSHHVPFAIIVLLGRLGGDSSRLLAGLLRLGLGGLGLGALVTRVVKGGKEVSSRLEQR